MTTPEIVTPKKLIEVALPLDAINAACKREKSIRHGHPSTLHLWWARRPLAAARSILFAQLVNDPSWKYSDEEQKKPGIRSAITRRRNELFRQLAELAEWESTTNARVLQDAHREIQASWKETCAENKHHPDARRLFDENRLPSFLDPFAGGGALPLEAQRLGLDVDASDLNPVAVLINKAMIEVPAQCSGFAPIGPASGTKQQTSAVATETWDGARGIAEDVLRYGHLVLEEARRRIGQRYPAAKVTLKMADDGRPDLKPYVGEELTPIAWIWARTVKSPNPAFAEVDVPLASSWMLGRKKGREAYIEPVRRRDGYDLRIRCGMPPNEKEARTGTKRSRANFVCVMSGVPITSDYIKAEGKAGRMGTRMIAVVAKGKGGRVYLEPTPATLKAAEDVLPPRVPSVPITGSSQYIGVKPYGFKDFNELFTKRQLLALSTFSELIVEVRTKVAEDFRAANPGEPDTTVGAYSDAVALYLAFAVSRMANYSSTLCVWSSHPKDELAKQVFGRQALQMSWDFAETNPFASAGGTFEVNLAYLKKAIELLPGRGTGRAVQADAASQDLSLDHVVSTDPPYFDNVPYADLADFFYAWLREPASQIYPELCQTIAVPKDEELVAFAYRHKDGRDGAEQFFMRGMTAAMSRLAATAHPAFPVTIYYAFRQTETREGDGTSSTGWESFLEAVLRAGFAVTGTWPVRTEYTGNLKTKRNALASSVVLVCRRRYAVETATRRAFLRELGATLAPALDDMTADPIASIAPVDLAQACIGPGMAVFSKYAAVVEADGSPMSVHAALVHINKAVDEHFAHAEGELDADTRFCVGWFEQYGMDEGPYGEADVLARAKGTAVDGVKEAGVIESGSSKVRLLSVAELPKGWDPTTDLRTPVWEALHHLCRTLGDSEGEAGELLGKMPQKTEAIRLLAYRLYTLCERKGWAEYGRGYNDLITSWPEIVRASQSVVRGQMDLV